MANPFDEGSDEVTVLTAFQRFPEGATIEELLRFLKECGYIERPDGVCHDPNSAHTSFSRKELGKIARRLRRWRYLTRVKGRDSAYTITQSGISALEWVENLLERLRNGR